MKGKETKEGSKGTKRKEGRWNEGRTIKEGRKQRKQARKKTKE